MHRNCRERDSMKQTRLEESKLKDFILDKIEGVL